MKANNVLRQLCRRNVGDNVGEKKINVGDSKLIILNMISQNSRISASEIAKNMYITQRTVERYIKELRKDGMLVRHGSARGGYWEVVK